MSWALEPKLPSKVQQKKTPVGELDLEKLFSASSRLQLQWNMRKLRLLNHILDSCGSAECCFQWGTEMNEIQSLNSGSSLEWGNAELIQNKPITSVKKKVPLEGGFPGVSVVKNPPANAGDLGSIPGSGRFPWRRKWQPTPVFLPGNPMDRGAWCWTRLRDEIANNNH